MSEEIRARLEACYQQQDQDFQISDLTAITDGWETEVYSFSATLRQQTEPLILRMYPGADAAAKCEHEANAILQLVQKGYPVPKVRLYQTDADRLGKPFLIMQKIDGRALGEVMREDTARQPELLTRFVQLLVDLHLMDYTLISGAGLAEMANDPDDVFPRLLARWRQQIVGKRGQAWAAPVLGWLDDHARGLTPQIAFLHGDFHPYNVLMTPDDKLYVIDWSGFSVGDYRSDLAWTLMLISTNGYPQLRDAILSEYGRLAGTPVEQIAYFDVLAALRRLVDFAGSVGSGAEAMGMRPETVAIMRGQRDHYRQVYALLQSRTGLRLPEIEGLLDGLAES